MTVKELIDKLTPHIDNINEIEFEHGEDDTVAVDFGIVVITSSAVPELSDDEDSSEGDHEDDDVE